MGRNRERSRDTNNRVVTEPKLELSGSFGLFVWGSGLMRNGTIIPGAYILESDPTRNGYGKNVLDRIAAKKRHDGFDAKVEPLEKKHPYPKRQTPEEWIDTLQID